MGRLPEVVGLVAVRDDGPHGRGQTNRQDQLESGVAWKVGLTFSVEPYFLKIQLISYINVQKSKDFNPQEKREKDQLAGR